MKKTVAASLIIFAIITTSVLTAGLVTYQNKKDAQSGLQPATGNGSVSGTSSPVKTGDKTGSLTADTVAQHSTQNDCWMTISGKVYNITSYFGQHPGGDRRLLEYCGEDATAAFGAQGHSAFAHQLLADFFVGNIGASMTSSVPSQTAVQSQSSAVVSKPVRHDEDEDD